MRKFRALTALNLKAVLNTFRFGGGKKRAVSGLAVLALLAGLSLYLSGIYSFLFAQQLAPIGMLHVLFLIMPVIAVALGFLFTLFAAQGVVFGGKDNDLMLALPVPAFTLMLSRTLALYTENLVCCLFFMLPAGVAYLAYGGGGGAAFLLVLVLCTLLLALLPTLLSLVIGFALAWASGKLGRGMLLKNLLYLAAFAVFMVVMMRLSFAMNDLAQYAMGMQDAFSGWGLPFLLFERAACEGDLPALAGLAGLCLPSFLLVVWLFAGRYKKIVTSLGARSARSDYKLERLSASGCRRALLKKEARKFFGTPIYLFNSGFGLLLMVGGSVAALLFREKVAQALAQMSGLNLPLLPLLAVAVCFLLATVTVTAPSISLEGKQLWILKEAPLPAFGLLLVKAGFQLLLTVPCLLVSVALLIPAFDLSLLDGLVLLLLGLLLGTLTALAGLFINLCMPKLDAPNDTVVVKQSASVLVAMLVNFLLVAAGGGLYSLLIQPLGLYPALLIPGALYALGCAALWALLKTKGTRMFLAL